jgi:hypothetical protein
MSEAGVFLTNILLFLIDLATLGLVLGVLYVIGLAVITMARNQKPNWESILYTVLILLAAIWLIRWYPQQVIMSIRTSLEESRPEAVLLREELQMWLPGTESLIATPEPVITVLETPTATPVIVSPVPEIVVPLVVTDTLPSAMPTPLAPIIITATPYPTYTPLPTATTVPTPTPCLVEVAGNMLFCPPTPVIGGK